MKQVTPVFAARTIGSRVSEATEDRVGQMLPRTGGAQEPAVIGHVGEQIRAAEDKLPGQVADGVFEANQRRDQRLVIREVKDRVFFSEAEIARHLVADHPREQGDRMPARNVFAKRHEMDLSIKLDATGLPPRPARPRCSRAFRPDRSCPGAGRSWPTSEKSMTKRWLNSSWRTGPGMALSGQTIKSGRALARAGALRRVNCRRSPGQTPRVNFCSRGMLGWTRATLEGSGGSLNLEGPNSEAHHGQRSPPS